MTCYTYIKLKGGDALIHRALRAVDAHITFHYFYSSDDFETGDDTDYILDETSEVASHGWLDSDPQYEFNGQILRKLGVFTALEAPIAKYEEEGEERGRELLEPKFASASKFTYLIYGNEPEIVTQYASICMIAAAPEHDIKSKWSQGRKPEEEEEEV
jgi:hypothetical protein